MASKRMFDKAIIDTDKFCDMPMSAKALYFLLGMEADDHGFVSPRRVMRTHGGGEDDLKILVAKNYVIYFESGVIVITDWNKNNYLQKSRTKDTEYKHELSQLQQIDGRYCLTNVKQMLNTENQEVIPETLESVDASGFNKCQTNVKQTLNQYSIEEYRREESSIEEKSIEESSAEERKEEKPVSEKEQIKNMIEAYTQNPDLLKELCDFYEMRLGMKPKPTPLAMKRILNELNKLTNSDNEKIEILSNSIMNGWKGVFALKKNGTQQQNQHQRLTAEDVYNIPFGR